MSARPRRQRRTLHHLSRDAVAAIQATVIPRGRRFQVVVDWRDWGFYARGEWPTPKCPVFRWLVHIGPFELRRWARVAKPGVTAIAEAADCK